jgi:hypothetical protein
MKTSPVQMLQLFFNNVSVEYDVQHAPKTLPNPLTSVITLEGVGLTAEVSTVEADTSHEHGQIYLVAMRLAVGNETEDEASSQVYSPYKINIDAKALVLILKGAEKIDTPQNLAAVNGASLIWSAIRDQVLNLTSRMPAGPVMLPTVTFQDLRENSEPQKRAKSANKRVAK